MESGTVHDVRAAEIVRELDGAACPLVARCSARQGDIVLVRSGDSAAVGDPTAKVGRMIAAGAHGEHRVVADSLTVSDDGSSVDLPYGGVVIHTDLPEARHRAIRLEPGVWQVIRQRELTSDLVVAQVRD